MIEDQYRREPYTDTELYKDWEVVFNPAVRHWYRITGDGPFRREKVSTRKGEVRVNSLTHRETADCFFRINCEAVGTPDLLFMQNSAGLIGIFSLVEGDDMGAFFRTDRGGFGYKSVRFYFDSYIRPYEGATHFLVTEDKSGEWAMFAVANLRDPISQFADYREHLVRRGVVKGCRSELDVLNALQAKYHLDLLEGDRYLRYNINEHQPFSPTIFG